MIEENDFFDEANNEPSGPRILAVQMALAFVEANGKTITPEEFIAIAEQIRVYVTTNDNRLMH